MLRKMLIALILIGIMAFTSGCGFALVGGLNFMTYNGTWEQEIDFTGNEVTIQGQNGTITVNVWDEPRVAVTASWSAKVENYEFKPIIQDSWDELYIASDRSNRDLGGTSFVVSVPKGIKLNLLTSNGRISVTGDALESLDVHTSNGAAMIDNSGTGQLIIDTSNGLVRISDWAGEIDCYTSNGAITAILNKISTGNYTLSTSNGGISVSLDPASSFSLSASTSNGSIRTALPDWVDEPAGTKYSGDYNGGGATLVVHSSNSNIQILPRN